MLLRKADGWLLFWTAGSASSSRSAQYFAAALSRYEVSLFSLLFFCYSGEPHWYASVLVQQRGKSSKERGCGERFIRVQRRSGEVAKTLFDVERAIFKWVNRIICNWMNETFHGFCFRSGLTDDLTWFCAACSVIMILILCVTSYFAKRHLCKLSASIGQFEWTSGWLAVDGQ